MKYLFIILFLTISIMPARAQQLEAKVVVKAEHLSPQERDELAELDQKLANYINSTAWSDENQDIRLTCNIQIIVETVSQRGSEKVYRAQFLISSASGENFYDKLCEFTYFPSQPFDFYRSAFEPILALTDYYIYAVLAGEMDTFELFSGSQFYDKAQNIANQGQLSRFPLGWQKRLESILNATNADHTPLREAKFYYYEGLYFAEQEKKPENVRQFTAGVVNRLYQVYDKEPTSVSLKRFFDAHFQEFPKLLKHDKNRDNIQRLIKIDPRHRDTYEKIKIKS